MTERRVCARSGEILVPGRRAPIAQFCASPGLVGAPASLAAKRSLRVRKGIELAQLHVTLLSRIEERPGAWCWPPVYAAVFGSMARGTATTSSDVDLLQVRIADDEWDAQVAELASAISKWTGNDARPIEFTVSDLVARREERIFTEVLATGLTVKGQRPWLQHQIGEK